MTGHLEQMKARQAVLDPLFAAQKLLGLITGAERSGLMALLADGATVDDGAGRSDLDSLTTAAVFDALVAGGVAECDGERYRLTNEWRLARSAGAFTPFIAAVCGDRVAADNLSGIGDGRDYWTLPPSDRITYAASLSPDPVEGGFVSIVKANAASGQPYAAALERAHRCLELGCGLAGAGLSQLVAFPGLSIVGVELSDELAAEAERRAEILGVDDRFTVVRGDAAEFEDEPESFDVGFWSQFFFPEESRSAALRTLFRHVRSGGTVAAPVRWLDESEVSSTSTAAQQHTLFRVMAQSWGVPDRNPSQVAEEFESAGFSVVDVISRTPTNALVVGSRP